MEDGDDKAVDILDDRESRIGEDDVETECRRYKNGKEVNEMMLRMKRSPK